MGQAFYNRHTSSAASDLFLYFAGTMPCYSSCSLPVQGHQILMGPQCSILFDEAVHTSGKEPECTVCPLLWSSHPREKHIPKDCKFCHQQAQGDPGEDEPEQQEDGDVHPRLSRVALEVPELCPGAAPQSLAPITIW